MERYELQKLATIYKTVWCDRDLSGFVLFSYKKVLRVKRTIMVRGSWLTGQTVRFGLDLRTITWYIVK